MLRLMKFPSPIPQISNLNTFLEKFQYNGFCRSFSVLFDNNTKIEERVIKLEQKVTVLANLVENLKTANDKMIIEKMMNDKMVTDEIINDKKISDKIYSDFKKVFKD